MVHGSGSSSRTGENRVARQNFQFMHLQQLLLLELLLLPQAQTGVGLTISSPTTTHVEARSDLLFTT
jgi:hypothetical protein